jgi:ATP-dependent helicase/nuclease subunit A
MKVHKPAPDQAQRDAAVAERRRNVLIDAGAGTGKTTILVDRLVAMVAPADGAPPVPIARLAAITFTRKAAGELRLRIRERLLEELAGADHRRQPLLHAALAGLDTAHVGTIHSFADRLLRRRPVEAQLSPSYEIAEDEQDLVHETFEMLLHAAQSRTLAAELLGTPAAARAHEATRTILIALEVGIRAQSEEGPWQTLHGLDALVEGFVRERDVHPPDPELAPFDLEAFRAAADELVARARPVRGESVGARWLADTGAVLHELRARDERDPAAIFRAVRQRIERAPARQAAKGTVFGGDEAAWTAWKAFTEGRARTAPLRDELCAPLYRWLATRLARLFPVVVALYEKVKARRQALDQLDLLVKLRDLLAADLAARGEYQRLFDHVFVDEFQDTDPLQAEIVLFLCEREPRARRWHDVELRDGALTLVGDPKQSIYRFRRADVATYDRVRHVVARGAHLDVTLSASFRSAPLLVQWLNDRFAGVLGASPDGRRFDAESGRVFHQPLVPGREPSRQTGGAPVHVVPFDFPDSRKRGVDEFRALEGRTLARYLRWLVEASDVRVVDPLDGRPRRVQYGDVAVLAITTWRLGLLFPCLDAEGIPYASRGGRLFLEDPRHRQLLLALRALADRDDGVAEAALLRPPFFALDLADLALERTSWREPTVAAAHGAEVGRVREARELVRELRRRRFDRPPGATARDLLDRTAFARTVALEPNGTQRLARVRELCLLLEQTAAREGLEYDAATARLREWIDAPMPLDPPPPAGADAVLVLTVHQAKGLEFPVVVLWDGKGQWDARLDTAPWRTERDGRGWAMNLRGVSWEEPAGLALRETERRYLNAERCRVVYVAATRARDLLVLPKAGPLADATASGPAPPGPGKQICASLIAGSPPSAVRELEPYVAGTGAPWDRELTGPPPPDRLTPSSSADQVERETAARWAEAAHGAARPRFSPGSVSEVKETAVEPAREAVAAEKTRAGRFGHVFGTAVHRAIGLTLADPRLASAGDVRPLATEAVRRAARRAGLSEHLDEAAADVERALAALRAEGLAFVPGAALQLEYPVAGSWDGGLLLSGYLDLVAATARGLVVLDFKTDAPPGGAVEATYPEYAAQVSMYARLLETSGASAGEVACGLLFTADGTIRWVERRPASSRQGRNSENA